MKILIATLAGGFGFLLLALGGEVSTAASSRTIRYDFSKKGVRYFERQELNRKVKTVAFDFSHGVDVRLTVKVTDADGQVFQRMFGILSGEWQHAELKLTDKDWKASGDGVFRQPAASIEFLVVHALSEISASVGEVRVKNIAYLAEEIAERGVFDPPLRGVSVDEALSRTSNAWFRLCRIVPQLEARGVGAKSRASLTVLEKFFGWITKDRQKGFAARAEFEAREMASLGEQAADRAEAILAGSQKDFPVPRYQTSKIEISHAQTIADRQWPDGRIDRGPVFFNGFGHFDLAKKDLGVFPSLGCNMLQIEIGPARVLTSENEISEVALKEVLEILDRAEKAGVGVNLLLSPHYWPKWTRERWPELKECSCYAGFCPYSHAAQDALRRYFNIVVPAVKDKKALHSICLTNEPTSGNYDKCPRLRKAWRKWLTKKYGTVAALKDATGLELAAFDDAEVPALKGEASPIVLDFIRFNRTCFAAWHRWMADRVHEIAPNVPVHAKIQINYTLWPCRAFYSVDPVEFARLSQYNGNDSIVFMLDNYDPYWGHNFWNMELGYDFQRSADDIPVFNSENHFHLDRSHGTYQPGRQTYAALWQNALHGQNASALWCWDRAYDDGKSDFNGLILERPESLEAYAHCALDLSRLADKLAPIQNLPPSVLVLYSTEGIQRGGGGALTKSYRAANFIGQPLGVVSEEMLAGFGRGTETRPFDSAKVLLLPLVKGMVLCPELKAGVDRFVAVGGRVLETADMGERDLHCKLAQEAKDFGLPDYPIALDPGSDLPSYGVETRGVTERGVSLISLCNQSAQTLRVKLAKAGTDLISGLPTAEEFEMRPLEVRLVEY